ncbi:LPXTG-motif cell wall anchor domain-containing protein [Bacillus sp. cl95]|nr:LPXTG-motif cell wall anchor domain-containing protein [Bacillus sp. UNCCL13]SFQ90002.1 LPXTG-motif cell wall anchor domain-containing protein [Bacillus sp. cl95]
MVKRSSNWFLLITLVFGFMMNALHIPVQAAEQTQASTLTVVGGETEGTIFPETSITLGESETAFDTLVKAVGQDEVEYMESPYGKMISGIKNVKATGNNYWAFYINGISAQVGADSYQVQDQDKLTFKLVDWTKPAEASATLSVIGKDGKELVTPLSEVAFLGEPTAFQFLQVAVGPNQVQYEQYDFGKMVTSINGVAAEGSDYWGFYVNGKMGEVGADSYKLKAGDVVSFKYESSSPPVTPGEGNDKPADSIAADTVKKSVGGAIQYALKNPIGDWEAIALKQAGKEIPTTYLETLKKLIKDKNGRFSRITDYERYTLGILAAGGNPTNIEGFNLVKSIYEGNVTKQGLNGVAYGLIALDSTNFEVPQTAKWTKLKLITELLNKQNADGGWSWDGSVTSDSDTTSMVLTALAPHKEETGIQASIDKGTVFLADQFTAGKIDNSSTASQIVIALSALGLDANETKYTKADGTSVMEYLLSFQNADGGFDWQGGDVSDTFSTSQGIQAVVAYQLMLNGKGSLYNLPLSLVKNETVTPAPKPVEQPQKHTDKAAGDKAGHRLPNTATNDYNVLAFGILLMMIGVFYFTIQRRKA